MRTFSSFVLSHTCCCSATPNLRSSSTSENLLNTCKRHQYYFLGIVNNMCSHEPPENNTLGTSTLDLQNTTITVIWAQADFSELYLVIQKGTLKYAMTYVIYRLIMLVISYFVLFFHNNSMFTASTLYQYTI